MRQPQFAGNYYERAETVLRKQIQSCFEGERGPGATPGVQKSAVHPLAVIAPSDKYSLSGACAAWSYKALGDAPLADVYIMLVPSHRKASSGLTQEPFQTPFGTVRVDQDFARRLLEKGTLKENDELFNEEWSLEVQLPFLQFCYSSYLEKIKILPIIVGNDVDLSVLAVDIKEVLLETNKKAVSVVSSNFTQYGTMYRYLPFSSNIPENLRMLDEKLLSFLKKGDYEGLLSFVDEEMLPVDGIWAISLLLRIIKSEKVLVEQFYTSMDVTEDKKNSVSYGSVVFY